MCAAQGLLVTSKVEEDFGFTTDSRESTSNSIFWMQPPASGIGGGLQQ